MWRSPADGSTSVKVLDGMLPRSSRAASENVLAALRDQQLAEFVGAAQQCAVSNAVQFRRPPGDGSSVALGRIHGQAYVRTWTILARSEIDANGAQAVLSRLMRN